MPLKPRSARLGSMPSQSIAARPAASTPAEGGWMSCNEAISTSAKTASGAADLAGGPDRPGCGGARPGHDEAGGMALGQGFDGLGFGEHAGLSAEQGLDPGAQARPIALGQVELAAEIEQGDLADLFAGTFGGDETEREVGFVGGFIPGRGFADEHDGEMGLAARAVKRHRIILWHYK